MDSSPAPPTIDDVLSARERIRPHLPRTPLSTYPALSELAGADVWVKHENHLPVGQLIDLLSS